MLLLSIAGACLSCALTVMPTDTPPAMRVAPPPLGALRSASDVIASSRLVNGTAPPSMIVLPTLMNRDALIDFMSERYPESAPAAPEMPYAWVFVGEKGDTHVDGIIKSTSDPALDSLALATARQARFKPALIGSVPVSLWVPLPIQISRPAPPGEKIVPYTKKPELLNRLEVSKRLVEHYPPSLYQRGIGGTVLLWVQIDEEGDVVRSEVKEGAFEIELNDAARFVARSMRFRPAMNDNKPVKVWVQIPVVFRAR